MFDNFNLSPQLTKLQNYCLNARRELHRIPEPSGKEFKTAKYCSEQLTSMGYKLTFYDGFTGFIADLDINKDFNKIAIRADMDALKMPDLTQNDYTSIHDGYAHNCGHDTHMAIALTTAKYLVNNLHELRHNVRFIFQMAEEDAYVLGANKMVELGCMNGVNEVYALHNNGALEYGCIEVREGIISSYGRSWQLNIEGISAHASTPHKGLDAIREGVRLINEMDYIVAKKTDPFSPAVFVCGLFNGGTVPNAVSDKAIAEGTIRSMDAETDAILCSSFTQLEQESKIRGFNASFIFEGYPAIINHKDAYIRIVEAANRAIPPECINTDCRPMTGSEDFSFMVNETQDKRGAMFFLGTGNSAKGIKNYLHSNPYYIEESALLIGAQIFINLATN